MVISDPVIQVYPCLGIYAAVLPRSAMAIQGNRVRIRRDSAQAKIGARLTEIATRLSFSDRHGKGSTRPYHRDQAKGLQVALEIPMMRCRPGGVRAVQSLRQGRVIESAVFVVERFALRCLDSS